MVSGLAKQGLHPDPADFHEVPPEQTDWTEMQHAAMSGVEMHVFQDALRFGPTPEMRAGVIDDLSTYYALSPDECVRRCLHWEELSTVEWKAKRREDPAEIEDFYRTTTSWSFDLLWYAYLQATGFAYPVQAAVAQWVRPRETGRRHLDFGSGAGVTTQMFRALGYESSLADISSTLLQFARFRLERRGVTANYYDLATEALPESAFDVITAIDTLAHVPDVAETAAVLHRALAPNGVLFANFAVRPPTDENAWHLYDDDLPLRWKLQRAGFEPIMNFDGMLTAYRRVNTTDILSPYRLARDVIALRSPLRPTYRRLRQTMSGYQARRNQAH